jgi:hypothetical protein
MGKDFPQQRCALHISYTCSVIVKTCMFGGKKKRRLFADASTRSGIDTGLLKHVQLKHVSAALSEHVSLELQQHPKKKE